MCERNASGFQTQTINDKISLTPDPINFTYIGPTSKEELSVSNKPDTKVSLTNVVYTVSDPICINQDNIETNVVLDIQELEGGPYKVSGGQEQEFGSLLESSIVFENLKINFNLKYFIQCTTNNQSLDDRIEIKINQQDFEKYYSYEGKDKTNIDVDEDLTDLLKQPNSPFNVQIESYIRSIWRDPIFGKKIRDEYVRIYCSQPQVQKVNEWFHSSYLFEQKLNAMKKLGIDFA